MEQVRPEGLESDFGNFLYYSGEEAANMAKGAWNLVSSQEYRTEVGDAMFMQGASDDQIDGVRGVVNRYNPVATLLSGISGIDQVNGDNIDEVEQGRRVVNGFFGTIDAGLGAATMFRNASSVLNALAGGTQMRARATRMGNISPTVLAYWDRYLNNVGRSGEDLSSLLEDLKSQGFTVRGGTGATFEVSTNTITYGSQTRKWELLEEYVHSRVANGWKKAEIASLTQEMGKNYQMGRKWITRGAPARTAEEIVVKQHLLDTAAGLNAPERELLQSQIVQLRAYGTKYGY